MGRPKRPWTEQQVEEIVGNLLRGGVILAAIVVAGGGLLYVIRHGELPPIIVCSTASRQTCVAYQAS